MPSSQKLAGTVSKEQVASLGGSYRGCQVSTRGVRVRNETRRKGCPFTRLCPAPTLHITASRKGWGIQNASAETVHRQRNRVPCYNLNRAKKYPSYVRKWKWGTFRNWEAQDSVLCRATADRLKIDGLHGCPPAGLRTQGQASATPGSRGSRLFVHGKSLTTLDWKILLWAVV